jgi:hypothetical protein
MPRQKDDDSSKAGPEQVHKGGQLVAHPVGSSSFPCRPVLLSVSCLILPARDGFLAARMPTHPEPFIRSSVGEKMVCIPFAWKDGGFSQGVGGEESQ